MEEEPASKISPVRNYSRCPYKSEYCGFSCMFPGSQQHIVHTTISNVVMDNEKLDDSDDMDQVMWDTSGWDTELPPYVVAAA